MRPDCTPIAHRIGDISEDEADALLAMMNDPNAIKHCGSPLPPGDAEALKRKARAQIFIDSDERDRKRTELVRRLVAADNWRVLRFALLHIVGIGSIVAAFTILRWCV